MDYIVHGSNIIHVSHIFKGGISKDEYICSKCRKIFTNIYDYRTGNYIEGYHIWKCAVEQCVVDEDE